MAEAKKAEKGKEKVAKKEKATPEKKTKYKITKTKTALKNSKERARLKKKRTNFKRQNLGKKKKVQDRWRTSRGIDAGQRKREKGKPAIPMVGYSNAKHIRDLHPSGFQMIRVHNLIDLESVSAEEQAILIASSVGKRKREQIQKVAQERKIQVLNFK